MTIRVRPAERRDAGTWLEMRSALWPEDGEIVHPAEIAEYFESGPTPALTVIVAEQNGEVAGFAELSIRTYAEGCRTGNVGFLEGWYVVPGARRLGLGRALLGASEAWALAQGCTEFGSNALADNHVSAAAHHALGFAEVETIRCFRKDLRSQPAPKPTFSE